LEFVIWNLDFILDLGQHFRGTTVVVEKILAARPHAGAGQAVRLYIPILKSNTL
jgi:hypothetical protein